MARPSLPLLAAVLGLGGLLLADALRPGPGDRPPADASSRRAAESRPGSATAGARAGMPTPPSPAARRAARERLLVLGDATFLDSLLVVSDSAIRRWAAGEPVRYAFDGGHPEGWHPAFADEVREAIGRWAPTPVRLEEVSDTADADVVLSWVPQFAFRRAGQTDLFWDGSGHLYRARVMLALRTEHGRPLPREARVGVAMHEVGHLLGLPHSADSADAMYEATRVDQPSPRDRRTLRLLYELPVGLLREAREDR